MLSGVINDIKREAGTRLFCASPGPAAVFVFFYRPCLQFVTRLYALIDPSPVAKFQPLLALKAGVKKDVEVESAPSRLVPLSIGRPVGVAPKQEIVPWQFTSMSPSVVL